MSTTRGIFESSANPEGQSPFAAGYDPSSPFIPAPRTDSPFAAVDDTDISRYEDGGKISKLPERRRMADLPHPSAEPSEGFGYDAPAPTLGTLPFHPLAASPFVPVSPPTSRPPQQATRPAPFTPVEKSPAALPPGFNPPTWPSATAATAPSLSQAPSAASRETDSSSIRQLELRAIFGLDREMSQDEILQRARSLPGIRHCARVNPQDMATIDATRQVLAGLGFNSGPLHLTVGSVPVDFIREGNVLLAIQTEGNFGPGVRETLMLMARELGRMA